MEAITIVFLAAAALVAAFVLTILISPTVRVVVWVIFVILPHLLFEKILYDIKQFFKSLKKQTIEFEGEIVKIDDVGFPIPIFNNFDVETLPFSFPKDMAKEIVADIETNKGDVISVVFGNMKTKPTTEDVKKRIRIVCDKYFYDNYYHCTYILNLE